MKKVGNYRTSASAPNLVVMVDSPRGIIARAQKQLTTRLFAFETKPEGPVTTPLSEGVTATQAMTGMSAVLGSMSGSAQVGVALGGLIGGLLGAAVAPPTARPWPTSQRAVELQQYRPGERRKRQGRNTPALVRDVESGWDERVQPTKATTTPPPTGMAFLISADVLEMTGAVEGQSPDWAFCLATLTDVWCDPYVVMSHMPRNSDLSKYLGTMGQAFREASKKDATFDLRIVADAVRKMVTP